MKKISTVTFHSPYNYGSCLQAYALQEYIKKLDSNCEYEIINLRTDTQKKMYENFFEQRGFKKYIKKIIYLKHKKELIEKEKKFEEFIQNRLNITSEFSTFEELKKVNWSSDYYIAGSDQLWNLRAKDFDWAYYLEFVESNRKISYAASFGPTKQNWSEEDKARVRKNLLKFKNISVREKGSFNNVQQLTNKEPEILVDPTMLFDKSDWEKLIPHTPLIKGDYIFLYNLSGKEYVKFARKISKKLKMPIVVSKNSNILEVIYGFKMRFDVGPIEFLNLIKNAKLVLSSSFHGTIFSILLNKPFFALNGIKDFRISTLLEKMGLEDRSIEIENYEEKCKKAFDINFEKSEILLEKERKKSREYLIKALDINE